MKTPTSPALRAILLACFVITVRALPAGRNYPQSSPWNSAWPVADPNGPVIPPPHLLDRIDTPSPEPPVIPQNIAPESPAPPPLAVPQPQYPQPSVAKLEAAAAGNPSGPPTPFEPPPKGPERLPGWHPFQEAQNWPPRKETESPFIPPSPPPSPKGYEGGDELSGTESGGSSSSSSVSRKASAKSVQRGASTRKASLKKRLPSSKKVLKGAIPSKKAVAKGATASRGTAQQRVIRSKQARPANRKANGKVAPAPAGKLGKSPRKQDRKQKLLATKPSAAKVVSPKPNRDARKPTAGGKKVTSGGASSRMKTNVRKGKNVK